MTLRKLIQEIEEMNDETLLDREIKYYHKTLESDETIILINVIGVSDKELLIAKECPESASKKVQESLNNIYKTEEN